MANLFLNVNDKTTFAATFTLSQNLAYFSRRFETLRHKEREVVRKLEISLFSHTRLFIHKRYSVLQISRNFAIFLLNI